MKQWQGWIGFSYRPRHHRVMMMMQGSTEGLDWRTRAKERGNSYLRHRLGLSYRTLFLALNWVLLTQVPCKLWLQLPHMCLTEQIWHHHGTNWVRWSKYHRNILTLQRCGIAGLVYIIPRRWRSKSPWKSWRRLCSSGLSNMSLKMALNFIQQ